MLYEPLLRSNLLSVAKAYSDATGLGLATIGRRVCKDAYFFPRVIEQGRPFTALQYDRVISRFAEEWPSDVEWPDEVPLPDEDDRKSALAREIIKRPQRKRKRKSTTTTKKRRK